MLGSFLSDPPVTQSLGRIPANLSSRDCGGLEDARVDPPPAAVSGSPVRLAAGDAKGGRAGDTLESFCLLRPPELWSATFLLAEPPAPTLIVVPADLRAPLPPGLALPVRAMVPAMGVKGSSTTSGASDWVPSALPPVIVLVIMLVNWSHGAGLLALLAGS